MIDWSQSKVYRYVIDHMRDGCCYPWPFATCKGAARIRVPRASGHNRVLYVSRLVCEIVNGPAPSETMEVRHLCGKGNSGCFNADCLRWGTRMENAADKRMHGTLLTCETHNMAKLTWPQVKQIRKRVGACSYKELATEFNVCVGNIARICQNKIWRDPHFSPADARGMAARRRLRNTSGQFISNEGEL